MRDLSNEITIKLKCSVDEIEQILKNKGFVLTDKFELNDIYYIKNDMDIHELTPREILQSYILIRDIKQYEPNEFIKWYNIIKLTYKEKNIAQNGDIISQQKYDCEIKNTEQGKNILKAIGYKEIMTIKENDVVYSKDGINIQIKNILNGDNLIEIETIDDNNKFDTIEKLKQKISELNIPIDERNFFVKKAEIELKKVLEI